MGSIRVCYSSATASRQDFERQATENAVSKLLKMSSTDEPAREGITA